MRSIKFLFPVLIILVASCTIQKRLHRGGYTITWHKTAKAGSQELQSASEQNASDVAVLESDEPTFVESTLPEVEAVQIPSGGNPCDTLRMKDGSVIAGVVTLVGTSEIHYKRCDNSGPEYVENKSEVTSIRYSDGREEVLKKPVAAPAPKPATPPTEAQEKKQEGFGIAGFILSLVGFFIAGIPLGILGIIFGAIGIGRVTQHPSTRKGLGFAVLSLVLGLFVLLLTIIVLF